MQPRRVVTGQSNEGKSIILSDEPTPNHNIFEEVPGLIASFVWETSQTSKIEKTPVDPSVSVSSWVPGPSGTNLMLITFPPDSIMQTPSFNPQAAGQEYAKKLPGLAEKFEPDHPGMHKTESIDYCILLNGEIHLELDDGQLTKLNPFDIVVQNATRHAWRNKSQDPATMLFVLVGAKRT